MKKIIPLLAAVTITMASTSFAQTWTSTAGGTWTTGTNWSTTPTAPANDGTAAILFNSAPVTLTSSIDTPYSISSLTFGSSAGNWTLSGSALTIGSGGIVNNLSATSATTISAPITIGASQTWDTGSAAGNNRIITLSGAITGTSDKTIIVSGVQSATGYRNFTLTGNSSGTLASNFQVDAGGRLVFGAAAGTLGTGTVTINTGGMVGGGSGSHVIDNNFVLAGGTVGALGFGGGGVQNGNVNITANSFVNMTNGSDGIVLGGGASSLVSGSGNLTQNHDSGTTTRKTYIGNTGSSVNNTNTGTYTINAGVLLLQKADNTVAWGGNIIINNGGMLQFNDFRENQIADTATVTINEGGIWNMSHGGSQNHEKITALVVNTTGTAFTNDTSAGGSRIVLGSAAAGGGTAGIFVTSGGSLTGTGIVNKFTTIDGGVLSAGDSSIESLDFSLGLNVTSLTAGNLLFTLGADTTAGTTYDTFGITGGLNIGTSLLGFNSFTFATTGGFGAGTTYNLFTSDALTGTLNAADLTGIIGGFNSTLSISGNNVLLTVVPEPATWALLAGSLTTLVVFRRRRRA